MRLQWVRQSGTTGALAFAALAVAAVSGIALALPFDVRQPYDSVALVLLANPGARFYRGLHYWSGQLFLLFTVAHAWAHLARSTERRLPRGVWARAALSLPLAAFLMLSGFILKGDPEGLQALRILSTTLTQIPLVGGFLVLLVFGPDPASLQVLYVHHVATATVLTWLIVTEHARAIWPRLASVVGIFALVSVPAFFVVPSLHDGLDPLLKGPWYFVGLQEILHAATRPALVAGALSAVMLLLVVLPRLPLVAARRVKLGLGCALILYGGITAFALFFRGESWSFSPVTPARASGAWIESAMSGPSSDDLRAHPIPVVLGRREGCLFCHADTRGMSPSHRPDAVGCSSCHAGNPFSLDRGVAHHGMILVPGNLDTAARTCGSPACHPALVARVTRSIMTTMSGVIAIDRAALGDGRGGFVAAASHPRDAAMTPAALGHSAADTHLRQLCASCHLGAPKAEPGPIDQQSRGGGCNACHLSYSREAVDALESYRRRAASGEARRAPFVHPDLSIRIANDHCFGCHSRSGRISTSYEGWHEASPGTPDVPGETRRLADGRLFTRAAADVHFEKGMLCVDCHVAREVMGDGTAHARKIDQVRVACEDCHSRQPALVRAAQLDPESRRIAGLRGRLLPDTAFLAARRGGDALLNTLPGGRDGSAQLVGKADGRQRRLNPPSRACSAGAGHSRLACISCHNAWSPSCTTCHTAFDPEAAAYDHVAGTEVRGAWTEAAGDFRAQPPTLGIVRVNEASGIARELVWTFTPGMIFTVDRNRVPGRSPDTVARRLFAPVFSHTVSRASRTCQSCHNDPVALGYGRGKLVYERTATGGRWTFTAAGARSAFDGLPLDAWIGFLEATSGARSSRPDARPLTVDEQKRVLTAGACLTCHAPDSAVMRDAIADFRRVVARVSSRCLLPTWQ